MNYCLLGSKNNNLLFHGGKPPSPPNQKNYKKKINNSIDKTMPTHTTWRSFYASKTKGKKFANKQAVGAHMKAVASEWRKMKGGNGLYLTHH